MRKPLIWAICPFLVTIIFPLLIEAQVPVMTIDQKEDPAVSLYSLKVDIKITGSLSITTLQMSFRNSSNRVLEGELTIPLPEGSSVSRYALDINGKMREAVPVDKAKGTQVFEAIERRRVDPGLLEKVEGNNFRTRIYPIPAFGMRKIIIAYEQELTVNKKNQLRYHLPLSFKQAIPEFDLEATVVNSATNPVVESDPGEFDFSASKQNYTASIHKKDFKPKGALSLLLPKKEAIPEVLMQSTDQGYYFLVNLYQKNEFIKKAKANKLTILWDVSLSSINRSIEKELELLAEYFKYQQSVQVELLAFNNQCRKVGDYTISSGHWEAIRKDILGFNYDGGTNYAAIKFTPSDEYLLFTDGLSGLNDAPINLPGKPVYTICSSPRADYSHLKYIAQKTGGSMVNLNALVPAEAIKSITERSLQILGYKENDEVEELYPSIATDIVNSGSFAGFTRNKTGTVTVLLGYGKTVIEEKMIQLNADQFQTESINVEKIWAQKKINELDIRYDKNKNEIERLGKTYGIVTRNTSLIVLETINDYLLYEIEPPEELRSEYDRIMKQRNQFTQSQDRTINSNAILYFNNLKNWYGIDTDNDDKKPLAVERNPSLQGNPGAIAIPPANRASTTNGDGRELAEVVIVGYSTRKKREVTTSVSSVSSNELNKGADLQTALAGRVPGLQVYSPNTTLPNPNSQIMLRGVSRLIIDGPQIILNGRPASWDEVQMLDPSDIETIVVQKTGYYIPTTSNRTNLYFNRPDPSLPKVKWNQLKYLSPDGQVKFDRRSFVVRESYISQLEQSPESMRYQKYLELRNGFMQTPSFFFNVATWFFEQDDYQTGLTILENLGELDLQDHELYKMIGYKMKELGEYEMAVQAFRKVLEWRPMEPQSYRDYGLALQDAGYYQQALDTLCLALNKNYAADVAELYRGIEEMIVTEINQLLALHKGLVLPKSFDKSLVTSMPVDLRVVANWNMNDTDIDLWVTDPIGEKCYFSHKNTQIGGRISNDFTRGYGPEQFLLKKAIKGKYKVQVNYYGQTTVKIVGATTVEVEIYVHYGSQTEQRQVVSFQTEQKGNKVVMVGEFEIK